MKLTFTHAGQERTLTKHHAVIKALALGQITEAQAAAKPWYLRYAVNGQEKYFKLAAASKEAIRGAKDIISGHIQRPDQFSAFIEAREAKRSTTIGELITDWFEAGLPFRKTEPRTTDAADRLRKTIGYARAWWKDKPVATITPHMVEDYAGHRSPALRSADLELAALSSLCSWAQLTGRIEKNPFAERPTFAKVKQHCHEASAPDDETLHRVLAYLFELPPLTPKQVERGDKPDYSRTLAGGLLAFCALTGLRPGEPLHLQRLPALAETPANPKLIPYGSIFPDRTGQLRMKVFRLKKGQNPFIALHPAAVEFLSAWRAWLAKTFPDSATLFPLGTTDQTTLNRALNAASDFLELPHYKPHGFGRAYYVKVRRSMGADDSTIAGELGQTTNGELIRSVYGDPQDMTGGELFDWLPNDCAPAWNLLAAQPMRKPVTDLSRQNSPMSRVDAPACGSVTAPEPAEPNQLAEAKPVENKA